MVVIVVRILDDVVAVRWEQKLLLQCYDTDEGENEAYVLRSLDNGISIRSLFPNAEDQERGTCAYPALMM